MTDSDALAAIQTELNSANLSEAERLCQSAVEQFGSATLLALLGHICLQSGKPAEAVVHCDKAIGKDPSSWLAHRVRSIARKAACLAEEVVKPKSMAMRVDPKAALYRRMEVAMATDGIAAMYSLYAEAPADVRSKIPTDQLDEIVQRVAGGAAVVDLAAIRARLNSGDASGAEALARESLTRFAELGELQGLLAYCLQQQGRLEEAVATSSTATDISPGDWLALFTRGMALRALGRATEARAAFGRAVQVYPSDVSMRTNLLETTLESRGFGAARLVMETAPADFSSPALQLSWRTHLVEHGEPDAAPAGSTTVAARIETARTWAERHGIAVVEAGPVEHVPVGQLRIWGGAEPAAPTLVAGYKPYVVELPNAIIASQSSLIVMADNGIVNDVGADPEFGHMVTWAYDKRVLGQSGRTVMVDKAAYAPIDIEGGIMLSGLASNAFGHWIPEYLCRLPTLEQHPSFNDLPVIVDADMPASHIDYLTLVCDRPIVQIPLGEAFRCRRLVYAPPPGFFPVELVAGHGVPSERQNILSAPTLAILRERVLAGSASDPAFTPGARRSRLFLGRRNLRWRRLTNEVEIEAALHMVGFETAYPEDLTLAQQIALFRDAEVIVAPNGSALLNLLFAPQGVPTVVLAQSEAFNWGGFQSALEVLGYRPLWVCSKDASPSKHADYNIEPAAVIAALESLGVR
ncbi:glycosyltransferase 61 family protein [Tardiphaga sp. OK245]|uniref:glycosyltransferase 61 family protein n=1 Tax=Tardiphaga sp. OK245 TaxID=1855306 RepID=UPI0008A7297A|nr:glycosyltransferase 61 family protein [Tardiphaga sp. OK245]SEI18962.1 Tetratricopeptide repeat-containing protein [Tardiphaga sp. OK245]